MTWPLVILAVMSIFAGWGSLVHHPQPLDLRAGDTGPGADARIRRAVPGARSRATARIALVCPGGSLLILLTGIGVALLYYAPPGFPYFVPTRLSAARTAERFGGIYRFLVHKWYFDELYWAVLVRPCLAFARLCREIDSLSSTAWSTARRP